MRQRKNRESVGKCILKSGQLKAKCHCSFSKQTKIKQKFGEAVGDALKNKKGKVNGLDVGNIF